MIWAQKMAAELLKYKRGRERGNAHRPLTVYAPIKEYRR